MSVRKPQVCSVWVSQTVIRDHRIITGATVLLAE